MPLMGKELSGRATRALDWPQVQALLQSIDRKRSHGLRDYTMLFLMAACGLRSSEVVALTLDDIDWRARVLRIPQRKTRRHLILPLTDEVGDVLQRYLKKGRRPSKRRELFFRARAPFGPLNSTSVHDIFNHRIRCGGLNIPAQGTYCLRRGFAVHRLMRWYHEQVDVDSKLPLLATYMGHGRFEYTKTYLTLTQQLLSEAGNRFAHGFDRLDWIPHDPELR